jgi:integrase
VTLKRARLEKQRIMAAINSGGMALQCQMPLSMLIEKYVLAHMPSLATTTQCKHAARLKNHIFPDLGAARMGDIDKPTIEAWLATKAAPKMVPGKEGTLVERPGLSKATRTDLRNLLSGMFSCAIEWGRWAGANPAIGVRAGRGGPVREPGFISEVQTRAFLDAIAETRIMPGYRARTLAELCLVAGLRVSEALALQWEDVNWEQQTVSIRRRFARGDVAEPKSASSRRTRYIGSLCDTLRLLKPRQESKWLFPATGVDHPPDDRVLQQHVWRPAAEALGIYKTGFGLHHLRRLSITMRQECGATLLEAMRQAGHSRAEMTELYTLADLEREKVTVQRLQNRIGLGIIGYSKAADKVAQ